MKRIIALIILLCVFISACSTINEKALGNVSENNISASPVIEENNINYDQYYNSDIVPSYSAKDLKTFNEILKNKKSLKINLKANYFYIISPKKEYSEYNYSVTLEKAWYTYQGKIGNDFFIFSWRSDLTTINNTKESLKSGALNDFISIDIDDINYYYYNYDTEIKDKGDSRTQGEPLCEVIWFDGDNEFRLRVNTAFTEDIITDYCKTMKKIEY